MLTLNLPTSQAAWNVLIDIFIHPRPPKHKLKILVHLITPRVDGEFRSMSIQDTFLQGHKSLFILIKPLKLLLLFHQRSHRSSNTWKVFDEPPTKPRQTQETTYLYDTLSKVSKFNSSILLFERKEQVTPELNNTFTAIEWMVDVPVTISATYSASLELIADTRPPAVCTFVPPCWLPTRCNLEFSVRSPSVLPWPPLNWRWNLWPPLLWLPLPNCWLSCLWKLLWSCGQNWPPWKLIGDRILSRRGVNREYGRLKFFSGRISLQIEWPFKTVFWDSFKSICKTITYVRKLNLKNNTRYVNEVRF